ncbi:MAG: hypothetical protein GF308_04715 [Candidatus Heimdallarchaeota archaeon]|nr:hypothetical protein [Candidatus Heimdallarchaeota archaeon]
MKFSLNPRAQRIILISTTVINYLLLLAYIFLLISSFVVDSYIIFLFSIPAYLLNNSWLFLILFFIVEILVMVYGWLKQRKRTQLAMTDEDFHSLFDEQELVLDEEEGENSELGEEELPNWELFSSDNSQQTELLEPLHLEPIPTNQEEGNQSPLSPTEASLDSSQSSQSPEACSQEDSASQTGTIISSNVSDPFNISPEEQISLEEELAFDKLWQEAIEQVSRASNSNQTNPSFTTADGKPITQQEDKDEEASYPPIPNIEELVSTSMVEKEQLKITPSLLKEEHREFFNEIALNSWIYARSADRKRVGIFKTALDETRFTEKHFDYLMSAGILIKMIIPFPNGPFVIYTLYENQDVKIVKDYFFKFCKKHQLSIFPKTKEFNDHQALGLEKKSWRFDFEINKAIVGAFWLTPHFLESDSIGNYSLTHSTRAEFKALMATVQLDYPKNQGIAVIITDYQENIGRIEDYIQGQGLGTAKVLAIGEQNFQKQFLKVIEQLSFK